MWLTTYHSYPVRGGWHSISQPIYDAHINHMANIHINHMANLHITDMAQSVHAAICCHWQCCLSYSTGSLQS